jgi:hypothetical protein
MHLDVGVAGKSPYRMAAVMVEANDVFIRPRFDPLRSD